MSFRRDPAAARPRSRRGFALLIVLCSLIVISLIMIKMTTSGRTQIVIAENLADNAAAVAAADGAAYEAIFRFLDDQPDSHWDANPEANPDIHPLTIGKVSVEVTVVSEAGKVNPNLAPQGLLAEVMMVDGIDPNIARPVAAAIADWREPEPLPRLGGAKRAQYIAAQKPYAPPGAPFQSLSELRYVLGMTDDTLAVLENPKYFSLDNFDDPDPAMADPVVAEALRHMPVRAAIAGRISEGQTIEIRAVAYGPGLARFTRVATVHIDPDSARGYQILGWTTPGD